jgi:predicted O-methyltransferase YrrM
LDFRFKEDMVRFSKKIKTLLKSGLNKLPYIKTLHKLNSNSRFPAGHFYSSVVSLEDIKERQQEIWNVQTEEIPGIELNADCQRKLITKFSGIYKKHDLNEEASTGKRYFLNNTYYAYGDGIILYCFLRTFKPKKIIEIGSGFSSALMLDVNEKHFHNSIKISFIEPYPEVRLNNLLKEKETSTVELIAQRVQKVPLEYFEKLEKGDILFIDSSHIVKTGSDVHYIINHILPMLNNGVLIHFHDIHFPFEYPKKWVLDGFGWNETYFIKSFLMYNDRFKIVFFTDYLYRLNNDLFEDIPLLKNSPGSGLWIEKTGP